MRDYQSLRILLLALTSLRTTYAIEVDLSLEGKDQLLLQTYR